MPNLKQDLCAAGLPIGVGPCEYCKATDDDQCGLMRELSPHEVQQNIEAAKNGHPPVNY